MTDVLGPLYENAISNAKKLKASIEKDILVWRCLSTNILCNENSCLTNCRGNCYDRTDGGFLRRNHSICEDIVSSAKQSSEHSVNVSQRADHQVTQLKQIILKYDDLNTMMVELKGKITNPINQQYQMLRAILGRLILFYAPFPYELI